MTEENKLTLNDCFLYPKATITSEPTIHVFSNVKVLIEYAHENMLTIQEIIDFTNLKLILRDIEQLTDEEKQYIGKTFLPLQLWKMMTAESWKVFKSLIQYCDKNKIVDLINYKREKNIMIESEDWFKSGKAVKDE